MSQSHQLEESSQIKRTVTHILSDDRSVVKQSRMFGPSTSQMPQHFYAKAQLTNCQEQQYLLDDIARRHACSWISLQAHQTGAQPSKLHGKSSSTPLPSLTVAP